MSTQIKKTVTGPLTAASDTAPAVVFVFPDESKIGVNLADLPAEVVTRLAVHGLSQKLGDSYAGAAQTENPLGYAKGRIAEVLEQLKSGDWRVTAEGGPKVTLLARALARATGKSLEDCVEVVDGLDDEQKKALRKDPRIKSAQAEIKLEDAKAAADRAKGAQGEEADLGSLFS